MPYPNNNRQNYRMRPNNAPPPTKNPYLSRQELKKKALEYNASQTTTENRTPGDINTEIPNQTASGMMPQNMLRNTNGNSTDTLPPFPTETINMNNDETMPAAEDTTMPSSMGSRTRRIPTPMSNDWADSSTRSWMDSLQNSPSATMPGNSSRNNITPRSNPYNDNRSFPWMNPRGDERLSPSTTRVPNNRSMGPVGQRDANMQNGANMNSTFDFLPRSERENQEYMKMIRRHPEDVRRIYNEVQKAFDRLSYNGSWIYDEHPDRHTLLRLSEDIYRSLLPITEDYDPDTDNPDEVEEINRTPGLLPNKSSPRWMLYVIYVLVQNELMHRRA